MSTGVGDEEFCGGSPLWNLSLTWNAPNLTWPQFTDCFQNTVLIWVPCGWVWVTLPFYIYYLIVHSERQRPLTCLSASKTIFSFILCLLSIIELVKAVENSSQDRVATVVYVSGAVKIATYLFVGILIQLERLSGLVTSGVLFLFWFLLTVSGIIPFYTKIEQQEQNSNLFNFILFYISYAVILLQLILHSFAEYTLQSEPAGSKPKCPETYASFPGRLTFWWLNRLVLTAYKKTLDECDLWELNPRDNSKRVIPQFQKAWIQEEQRCERASRDYEVPHYGSQPDELDETAPLLGKQKKTNKSHQKDKEKKASLLKVMMKIYGSDMLKSHLCKFFYDLLQFVSPLILNVLIEFTGNHDLVWKGYMYSVGLFVVATMQSILFHQNFHIGMTLAMRMKSALISAIYKKALTVCSEEKKSLTVGEIVNLMSVDCQRIQDLVSYLWILWSAPLQISLSLYLLYNTMGSSIFAGLGIMILMIPLNGWITTKTRNYQSKQMKIKDERIKLMNEVLNGVKVLKLYAWEPSFKQKILKIRNKELTLLKKSAYLYAVSLFFWTCVPFVVTVATFTTYVFISEDHRLDSQKAFVALSLFNILRSPLNLLPMLIAYVAQAQVSVSRINRFLNTKDLNPKNVIHEYQPENVISIKQGSFTWDREGTPGLLDINLEVPAGKLVAVVGQVGAGKSSLISGILGEMEKLTGTVNVQGSVAYVPQQAWIQNATLHDNILFGSQLKGDLYKKVIDACALKHDLGILPGGDMTEIGERGINLSGGQKQRVSLARAVYNSADIYLLDDPLSAVDSHVGKHIFNEVIGPSGLLKKQTRILVTHGVHWLPQVDLIVVLVNGRITELGSYNDLLSHNGAFAQFLKTYLAEDDSSDDDDPEIMHLKSEILQRVDSVVSGGVPSTTSEDEAETKLTRRSTSRDSSKFGQCEGRKLSLSRSLTKEKKLVAEKAADGQIVGKRLTEEEQSETGKVKLNVYILYAKALGATATALMFLMFGLYQVTTVFSSVWLSKWTEDPLLLDSSKINTTAYRDKTNLYLGVFGSLGIVQAVMVLTYSILSSLTMVNAAGALHKKMLHNILRSPMSFFDTTPLGRIINRFSRDMETIDNNLPMIVRSWIATIFTVMSTIVVISYSTPIFLSVIFPLGVLYYLIQRFFIPTSRQLKRIESTTRSPIYTHFSETITGASSIRAYRAVQRFIQESQDYVDKNLVFYFGGIAANRWLGFRLELVGNTIVLAAATFTVMNRDTLNGGLVGLSITYALQITQFLNWLVRNTSELETNIVSVERVMEYSKTPTEAEWELPFKPVSGWPQHGVVEFRDYCTRYRPGLDLVLRGISCYIKAGEKVGIVGRTGAGKSSLTVALFRLIESAGGAIMIDDQRISDIGLHDLRSKLTILPQDPVLFSGSLRFNLDPFDQHADEQIWQALEHAHLKQFVMELPLKLEHECGEGGQNLSVGQSQLLCLARTLLHKTNILILDEATAAVDMETDDLIQTTIREEFKQCTVLTIAHRLNTIMDYDRVMVLDAGLIKEFDSPHELLQNKKSIFYGMAKDAGLV